MYLEQQEFFPSHWRARHDRNYSEEYSLDLFNLCFGRYLTFPVTQQDPPMQLFAHVECQLLDLWQCSK